MFLPSEGPGEFLARFLGLLDVRLHVQSLASPPEL